MSNHPTPYTREYYEYFERIKNGYQSCSICGNEMNLIKTSNGNYYICKVCNNTQPYF